MAPDTPCPYEISVERQRRCLHIAMRGRWTDAVFDRFAADLEAAEREMHGLAGISYTLVDGRAFEMQDPALAARFPEMMAALDIGAQRRTAVVTSGPLANMQARPAGNVVNARFFRSMESAADWLFSDEA